MYASQKFILYVTCQVKCVCVTHLQYRDYKEHKVTISSASGLPLLNNLSGQKTLNHKSNWFVRFFLTPVTRSNDV